MPKGDPEFPKINLNTFLGGESVDLKNGISGSFSTSLAMDFREKASQMTVLPGLYNVANNLKDLPTVMEQDINGIRYMVGDQGWVYRINDTNVVSQIGQLDSGGGAGLVYNSQSDLMYMSSQQTISLYGQTSGVTPASLKVAQFGPSASVSPGVIYIFDTTTQTYDGLTDPNTGLGTQRNNLNTLAGNGVVNTSQVTNTLTNTYFLPNTIQESSTNLCGFIPDISPLASVSVWLKATGTGDVTLTMHDSLNNNLGAVTIVNADLVDGWNSFVFTLPGITVIPNNIVSTNGAGYHFHLTSSVASDTTTCATIASNDLNGCNFVLFAHRMFATNNGWHPMASFNSLLCIGNGMYLSTYNGGNDKNPNNSQYFRHQLTLDNGYEISSLAPSGQYLVITAGRTSNSASRQYQGGYIYLWDGINTTYNMKVPVPMGTPYAAECVNNVVYFICNGSQFAYAPGSTTINKVRYIGYQNTNYLGGPDTTIVNPNMMTTRYNLLLMAYPSSTTQTNLNMGIYSWGSVELIYPNSFGFSYLGSQQIQNYSKTNNYQIGMIENYVDTLYMSSQYTDSDAVTHYMLDVLDNTSSVAPTFNLACLIWDGGVRYKMKKGLRVKVSFLPLPAGITITPWFNIDRNGEITADPSSGESYTVGEGATDVVINIPGARSHELQWGFNGTAAPGTVVSPTITGITAEIDSLDDEPDLRSDG
jgi:hypothetical protein